MAGEMWTGPESRDTGSHLPVLTTTQPSPVPYPSYATYPYYISHSSTCARWFPSCFSPYSVVHPLLPRVGSDPSVLLRSTLPLYGLCQTPRVLFYRSPLYVPSPSITWTSRSGTLTSSSNSSVSVSYVDHSTLGGSVGPLTKLVIDTRFVPQE